MKNKKMLIILSVVAVVIIGIIIVMTLNQSKVEMAEFYDANNGAYVSYDSAKWEVEVVDSKSALVSKETSGTSINILSETVENYSEEQYYSAIKDAIKSLGDSAKIVSEEDATINNLKAKSITYEMKRQNDTLKIQQSIVANKNTVYVITYGGLIDDFDTQYNNFKEILKTFKVK